MFHQIDSPFPPSQTTQSICLIALLFSPVLILLQTASFPAPKDPIFHTLIATATTTAVFVGFLLFFFANSSISFPLTLTSLLINFDEGFFFSFQEKSLTNWYPTYFKPVELGKI